MADAKGKSYERWTYDLFLSFRGEDVRETFVSFLYSSLESSGTYAFKDDERLESGENISTSLLEAIENSKIHLVVLSKNYASSTWCLDELVHIVECNKINSRHVLLPIFYNIHPSDLRRQRGSVAESFHKHASRYPESKLLKWKEALTEAANLSGFVKANYRSEAELVQKVTIDIGKKLSVSYLQLPTYSVGIRSRVQHMYELMGFGSGDVLIIGICGMGGIGKTTLAKAACNEFSDHFEGTSFLENFGEYSKKPEGKAHLQRKLLSDILRREDVVFKNMDHAVKQRFRNKRILVVVDDVEDMKQLNSGAIDLSCFGPGSRIIITSRNKHLLWQLGVEKIYSLEKLNSDESLELVSRHAFRTRKPPEAFLQLSEKLVKYCGGLPLAMEVLGAFLFKRSISEWKSTLESLKRILDDNIQAKLQISFDALNAVQKEIFLDISCFFIGMDKDYVSCILDGCNLDPGIGLSVLKERFLITVHDNRLMMHDLLRDMGRQIVRGTSPNNCERWSRLWDPNDAIDVLANYHGTDAIEGLSLKAKVTAVENLEVISFSNLRRLRLLQLRHVQLDGSYDHFPRGLRWLWWFAFPLESVPTNFHLRSLVVMDMQHSNLKRLWDDQEPQFLKNLRYLDLSHSVQLIDTPNFSYLPNLEKLLLINCKRLVLVHKSIGTLHKKLVLLNLKGCAELGDLPLELYTLKSLETLILSGCLKLERLDDALGEMESLTILKADYTALTRIPSSINQLKKLKELSLDGCKGLWKDRTYPHSENSPPASLSPPISLDGLSCLKTLRLRSCNLSDDLVPANLGSLSCLEELDLQGNNFRNLQTDFAGLLSLQTLKLDGCSELQSMSSLPKKLRSFYASNCIMLERTPDLSECSVLQLLHLRNCFNLVETPGLEKLKTVGVIHMEMCNRISDTFRERLTSGWNPAVRGGIFIPGPSRPNWVSFKYESHSISFTMPETLNPDLVGFNLWTPYVSEQDSVTSSYSPTITVKNQTKGIVWRRKPATDHIRMYREKHMWQGDFLNEDIFLETGDRVEVFVDFGDQVTNLERGLTLAYREGVTVSSDSDTSEICNAEVGFLADLGDQVNNLETGPTLAYRNEDTNSSDSNVSEIGHDQNTDEASVDDELVVEESQSRPRKKLGMGLKTLLGAFGVLAFVVIVGKDSELLRLYNRFRRFFSLSRFLRLLGLRMGNRKRLLGLSVNDSTGSPS